MNLWLPPLLYMVVIFHLSSESNPVPELTVRVWDKLLHTVEYGGLGFLISRALLGEGIGWFWSIVMAIVCSSVYGASDEWHQMFVPLRTPDVRDWLTDSIGSAAGAALYLLLATGRKMLRIRPELAR